MNGHSVTVDLDQLQADKLRRDAELAGGSTTEQYRADPAADLKDRSSGENVPPGDTGDQADGLAAIEAWHGAVEMGAAMAAQKWAPAWQFSDAARYHLCRGLARQLAAWFGNPGVGFDLIKPDELHPLLQASWGLGALVLTQLDTDTWTLAPRYHQVDQEDGGQVDQEDGGQVDQEDGGQVDLEDGGQTRQVIDLTGDQVAEGPGFRTVTDAA